MKKTILLLFSLCITLMLQAAAPTTLTVASTAGGLSTAITTAGGNLNTIDNLTVTGTIDARDFLVMGDSMPVLSTLNLSAVTIAAYYSAGGTQGLTIYAANEIPTQAFMYCTHLTSITLPSSVTSIREGAFFQCTSLTSVNIPSSVTSIGNLAFYGCSGLTSVTIPSSVTSIGDNAFEGCSGLTSITIPSSVTSIGWEAFYNCSSLTSITIPSSVTSIGGEAFYNCSSLTSITIPSSVTSIGDNAFEGCSGLITVDANNPNYSSLDGVLFNKAKTTLIQCTISKTGSYVIPASVTSIGYYAFEWCTALTSVTIPASVTSIGVAAFECCSSLTSIYSYPTTPVDLTSSPYVFLNVNTTTCTLYVPTNSINLYKAANQWKDFYNIVGMPPTATQQIKDNISIYPNPVINNFNISGLSAPQTLQLFDLNGKLILSQQVDNGTVPASFLKTGIYILKIGSFETKLIKQ